MSYRDRRRKYREKQQLPINTRVILAIKNVVAEMDSQNKLADIKGIGLKQSADISNNTMEIILQIKYNEL